MFDIGASELLLIVVVAIVVIGPKDMPAALRAAGRWIGKVRRVSNHFRSGIETMIREAEMEEMERKWKEQNAKIMAEHPDGEVKEGALPEKTDVSAEPPAASAESRVVAKPEPESDMTQSPQLPLEAEDKKG